MESKGYDKQIEFLMLMPYSYLNIILQTQIIMSLEKNWNIIRNLSLVFDLQTKSKSCKF